MAESVLPQPINIPESTSMLLPDLEAIERVIVEKKGANLKAKEKGSTTPSEAKGNPKRKASGGLTGRVPKRLVLILAGAVCNI